MRNMGGSAFWIAALLFGGAAGLFGWVAVDAIVLDEIAGEGGDEPQVKVTEEGHPPAASPRNSYPKVTNNEILEAVNQDLFQPTRTPSLERYLLPSERLDPVRDPRDDRRRREPELRIVGTAIAGNLSLALVQPEDSVPIAVLLGEVVDGFTLAAVTEEFVTLTREDAEFTFPVVEPQRGRSSNSRNNRERGDTEAAARALNERVQQMLQQMGRGQQGRGGVMQNRELPISIQLRGGQAGEVVPVTVRRRTGGGGGGEGGTLP